MVTIRNQKLAKLVSRCEDITEWELFQYYDEEGKKQSVDSSLVNKYLHEISGTIFTAKDFRTWAGSVIFFDTLMDLGMVTRWSVSLMCFVGCPQFCQKNSLLKVDYSV